MAADVATSSGSEQDYTLLYTDPGIVPIEAMHSTTKKPLSKSCGTSVEINKSQTSFTVLI